MQWNSISNIGNLTRSMYVNDAIKRVKKTEVQKQGKQLQAHCSCTKNEFINTQKLLREQGECVKSKYGIRSLNNFQYHMISCVDNCTQFFIDNIERHPHFQFALKAKLCWSKNMHKERDALWQVVLGSTDHIFCVMISLSMWLEVLIGSIVYDHNTPYIFGFNDNINVLLGGKKSSSWVQDYMSKNIFSSEFYSSGKLGTNSYQKFATTECRKRGCTRDKKDIRGR